jgi:radical SAM superfamily enzyme YgiQ (UPF0313 family)
MQPPIAPLGLEYLAASLKNRGYEPVLCDLAFTEDWRTALTDALAAVCPLAIGVSIRNLDDAYFASQDFILEKTGEVLRCLIEESDAPVILGGVGFSVAPREVLAYTGAAYGIAGEGEDAFPDLLDCLAAGGDVSAVDGAVFRTPGGEILANPPAFCDLSGMPTPPRRFLDNVRYFNEGGQAGIETKRGCNKACIYCVEPMAKGNRIRLRRPKSVVEEFADLLDQGIDVVHLCDSEFNLPQEHALSVCEALIHSGLGAKVRWYTYAYPTPFEPELAKAMVRACCAGIDFGVDHACPTMLGRLGRFYGAEEIRQTVRTCHDAGITVMFDMLFGAPGETRESIAITLDLMREVEADRVGLSCGVRVYPGTALARTVLEQGSMAENPNLYGACDNNEDFLRPVFYVDAGLEGDIHRIVSELVDGDRRFLHADPNQVDGNYNYNDNSVLSDAIRSGARGAYWDILRCLDGPAN